LLIFFYSIVKMQKPSDQLTRDDVNDMRRGKKPGGHNGNDWRYRGSRGNNVAHLRFKSSAYGWRMRRRVIEGEWEGVSISYECVR
jgi:hypothetical protein